MAACTFSTTITIPRVGKYTTNYAKELFYSLKLWIPSFCFGSNRINRGARDTAFRLGPGPQYRSPDLELGYSSLHEKNGQSPVTTTGRQRPGQRSPAARSRNPVYTHPRQFEQNLLAVEQKVDVFQLQVCSLRIKEINQGHETSVEDAEIDIGEMPDGFDRNRGDLDYQEREL